MASARPRLRFAALGVEPDGTHDEGVQGRGVVRAARAGSRKTAPVRDSARHAHQGEVTCGDWNCVLEAQVRLGAYLNAEQRGPWTLSTYCSPQGAR